MATPDTVKPLVDRILSHPLHFKISNSNQKKTEMDEKVDSDVSNTVPYIMIGKSDEPNGNNDGGQEPSQAGSDQDSGAPEGHQRDSKRRKVVPKSLQEALSMYTKGEGNSETNSGSTSDSDGDRNQSGSEEVYHEAKEFATGAGGEEEDLGEDLGVSEGGTDLNDDSSSEEDQDFEDQPGSASEVDDSDEDDESDESDEGASAEEKDEDDEAAEEDEISEDEKLQLQQEALEAKSKENSKSASATPVPESKSQSVDISSFYQFNEEVNDAGSVKGHRIVKNWGPYLTNLRPKGLLNHGVTCYTNAAVQAMVHIPAVQHYLFDILRGKHSDKVSPDSVSYAFAEITKRMWSPQDKSKKKRQSLQYINPKKLIARLDDINCMMSVWQQEDSHEYFMSLMSRLQEDSVPRGHKLTESILYDIFGGVLEQVVTCKSCGSISKTEQPFYDLSLHLRAKKKQSNGVDSSQNDQNSNNDSQQPLQQQQQQLQQQQQQEQNSRKFSIEKSISDFFSPELIKVDKEQKGYVCERCHMTTNAIKHNSILRAPETLLVHLKKFRFNGTSSSKMKQAVSYPMFLDLTDYCVEGKELPLKYQLITVVVHEGRSLSSGHYIVHCKQPEGHWATYDDEYINNINEKDVLREPNAYYLVYTRLTPKEAPLRSSPLVAKDWEIPDQSSTSSGTPISSPKGNKHNNNNKKWKKNKKRRFNQ
ncbi:ZYRO0C09812p [Zygosaccharomyces rouxii]|uniref:ubiquitinyl hydrolase 1 n=1 Tax=Zygosaccharomyces rouxii (strain ATCC 2623 / CBS 732 / NBRC 1130 / NCYC 568 / NRRL Y-229) TaxID=559307 RepID=C5DTM7_ZYGRC|nr:uncharacterized protein ZYRO0C09812g [Zygosaccharomyces rouxii]KAH9201683.1 hypothetical protein LQ764DRAFT_83348 [Zygosaccharomyces rouxii]CAR27138.1 ZYRO0C09812p [Zygosaccharomyces rouxii]